MHLPTSPTLLCISTLLILLTLSAAFWAGITYFSSKLILHLASKTGVSVFLLHSRIFLPSLLFWLSFISQISKHWRGPGLASSQYMLTSTLISSKFLVLSSINMLKTYKCLSAWASPMILDCAFGWNPLITTPPPPPPCL